MSYQLEVSSANADAPRQAALKLAGLDAASVVFDFNAGRPLRLDLPSDTVPLPLPIAAWRTLPGVAGSSLPGAILRDQRASWLYYGLCGMDDETRRYLAGNPQLLGSIYQSDRPGVVALHGGSLHVRDGRIEPPGGGPAVRLWEQLAGVPVTEPGRFMLAVLGKIRLAHLYDAVDRMDSPVRAFTLGSWISSPGERAERFKALYEALAHGLGVWDPVTRPFARGVFDPGHVLLVSPILPDGSPGSLGWVAFWERAFDGETIASQPNDDLKDIERGGRLDAASLIRTVMTLGSRTRKEQCEAWCFGQRLFAKVPRESLSDVLVPLRGYSRYGLVGLTLERLGIADPSVHAVAFRRAEQISRIDGSERTALALALQQGALVLIERARLAGVFDTAAAARLVMSLDRLPLSTDGEFLGAVPAWIESDYLPAVGWRAGQDADASVLAAFAGRREGAVVPERFIEYEGTRYRVDPSHSELARLRSVREKQGGASLEAALAFAREVRNLPAALGNPVQLPDRIAGLRAAGQAIEQAQPRAASGWSRPADLSSVLRGALGNLPGIRKPQDSKKAEGIALELSHAADWELARVLVSLAYAASIGDAESTMLVAGDPSPLHDWGIAKQDEGRRVRTEWGIPRETHDEAAGGRWHIEGALLALDVGLGTEALRRLSSDALSAAPTISDNHRKAFTESSVLANACDYADEDMAALAQAIEGGRARVTALATDASQLPALAAAAGLDTGRRALLSWAVEHDKGAVGQFFSLGDLLRLGQFDPAAAHALDAWGTSGLSYDGRLCLRFPVTQPAAALSGRWSMGVLPTLLSDLPLLVAEALYQRRLPAVLARSLLLVATPDYMDRLALDHEDDWLGLVGGVRRILPGRIDDYLTPITTGGPLVPVGPSIGGRR